MAGWGAVEGRGCSSVGGHGRVSDNGHCGEGLNGLGETTERVRGLGFVTERSDGGAVRLRRWGAGRTYRYFSAGWGGPVSGRWERGSTSLAFVGWWLVVDGWGLAMHLRRHSSMVHGKA